MRISEPSRLEQPLAITKMDALLVTAHPFVDLIGQEGGRALPVVGAGDRRHLVGPARAALHLDLGLEGEHHLA